MTPAEASKLICEELGPGDLQAPYNQPPPGAHRLWGHCAIASEALFYSTGGKGPTSQLGPDAGGPHGWAVWRVRHEGSTHWFLKDKAGKIWDLTAQQFKTPVPYHLATKTFFVTKTKGQGASKRTVDVLRRIKEKRMSNPTERPLSFDEVYAHQSPRTFGRMYFAALAKLARAPGGFLDLATAKLTRHERRRLGAMANTGRFMRWVGDRRSSGTVEMRAAGWALWNSAVDDAMEERNAQELRLALAERKDNPVSDTHPYTIVGTVESGDTIASGDLDGYGLARAERDFRLRPDAVSYNVRGTHGGPRSYSNVSGSWERVSFVRGGPREDWAERTPRAPHVFVPDARMDAMSAREEARMGRLMRGRMENPAHDTYYVIRSVTDRKGRFSASNASWHNSVGTKRFPDVIRTGLSLDEAKRIASSLASEDEENPQAPPGYYTIFSYERLDEGETSSMDPRERIIQSYGVQLASRSARGQRRENPTRGFYVIDLGNDAMDQPTKRDAIREARAFVKQGRPAVVVTYRAFDRERSEPIYAVWADSHGHLRETDEPDQVARLGAELSARFLSKR